MVFSKWKFSQFLVLTAGLVLYSCNTSVMTMENTSMEGTIKKGADITVRPAGDILRGQIIAFKYDDQYLGEQTGIMRVVGIPGDTVKVSLGQVFVNGKPFEEPEKVKYMYQVIIDGKLPESVLGSLENEQINSKEYVFYLTGKEADILRNNPVVMTLRIMVRDWGNFQPGLFGSDTVNNWNVDNYGPVKVPLKGEYGADENLYFVMGDNRHNAIDSRYIGYIPESDILGIVKYQ